MRGGQALFFDRVKSRGMNPAAATPLMYDRVSVVIGTEGTKQIVMCARILRSTQREIDRTAIVCLRTRNPSRMRHS